MSKRRTKKDKERANYSYLISWSPGSKIRADERDVKRQFEVSEKKVLERSKTKKNADNLVKGPTLASQKKDIIKSLMLASFILSLEIVVYLLS